MTRKVLFFDLDGSYKKSLPYNSSLSQGFSNSWETCFKRPPTSIVYDLISFHRNSNVYISEADAAAL